VIKKRIVRTMSNIHIRIKEARMAKGLSQTQLAKMVGVSATSVQLWEDEGEAGTAPKRTRMPLVAEILGVTVAWLHLGVDTVPPSGGIGLAEDFDSAYTHQRIMMYDIDLSAGKGNAQWVARDTEEPLLIRNVWFKSKNLMPDDLRAIRFKGNSMVPHLENNDIVMININDTELVDDEIYAINYNDNFFIKRLRQTGDGIDLISSNSDYETIKVSYRQADTLEILGKKVWRCG
jgi:transcriptional regulator with XRE-family HTH domain